MIFFLLILKSLTLFLIFLEISPLFQSFLTFSSFIMGQNYWKFLIFRNLQILLSPLASTHLLKDWHRHEVRHPYHHHLHILHTFKRHHRHHQTQFSNLVRLFILISQWNLYSISLHYKPHKALGNSHLIFSFQWDHL